MNQREKAYIKIRNAITYGELKPGERLIDKRLCAMFKIGRTPLREALTQLHAECYVVYVPNKGTMITTISHSDMENIFDVLALLESHAVEMATRCLNAAHVKRVESILNDQKHSWTVKNYRKWVDNNEAFHEYLVNASGNSILSSTISNLRNRIYRYRLIALTIPGGVEEYFGSHEEICEAIKRKKPKLAAKAMRKHILHVRKRLSEFVKQFPGL